MAAQNPNVWSFKTIINFKVEKSVQRTSTDVYSFVLSLSKSFHRIYLEAEDPDMIATGYKYLVNLYNEVVFNGKDYKKRLPRFNGMMKTNLEGGIDEEALRQCQQVDLTEEKIWCYVVRGSDGAKNIRSEIMKVAFIEGGTSKVRTIPVLTFKLFQACLSIMLCLFNLQKKAKPARLGANHVRACKIPAAASDKDNWAVHTHSGMHFVAKYVFTMTDPSSQYHIPSLPPVEAFLVLAYKMDTMSARSLNKPKSQCLFALKSIFQTTGMSVADLKKFKLKIKASDWGESFDGVAESLETC